jgi:hypothetical protein
MSAPVDSQISVRVTEGGDEGWTATATTPDGLTQTRENENPYEAAWNALAGVMTALGYDEGEPA